jgi:predicted anti-sigma-YlaC factor YlaD
VSASVQKLMDTMVGSCEETQEQLSDRLEGELRRFRRLRVAAHLARCDRCRPLMRSLARTVEQVRLLGKADFAPPPPSRSISDDVAERIRRERR